MSAHKSQASNAVRYRERVLKARIDPQLPVRQVIKQLAAAFKTEEAAGTLALRDADDILVTDDNLTIKVMEGDDLKVVASPAIEALDTISALSYALQPLSPIPASPTKQVQPSLKLALFKLQKYIKEEEFSHEFMLKGGMQLLVKLLGVADEDQEARPDHEQRDTRSGGNQYTSPLTGNMLAYALQSFAAILELHIGWEVVGERCIRRLVHIIATAKTHNICRPATEALSQLVGPVRDINFNNVNVKGKNRADERQDEFRHMGITPLFPAMREVPGFLLAIVKRIDSSDLEMGSKSLELVNSLLGAAISDEVEWDFLQELGATKVNDVVKRAMSVYEHTGIRQYILDFQRLELRRLQLAARRPLDMQDPAHHKLVQIIIDQCDRSHEQGVGPSDRRIARVVDQQSDNMFHTHQAPLTSTNFLAVDLLASTASYPQDFAKMLEGLADIEETDRPQLTSASSECARLLLACFTSASQQRPDQFQPMLLGFRRIHALVFRLFLKIWQVAEADQDDMKQVCESVAFHIRYILEEDPLLAWHTLESKLLDTQYDTILERQLMALERNAQSQQPQSVKDLSEALEQQSQEFLEAQRLDCLRCGTWFYAGLNLVKPDVTAQQEARLGSWRFVKLSDDFSTVQWGAFAERMKSTPPGRLPEILSLNDIVEISFSLINSEGISLLDLVAPSRDEYTEWMEGLAGLFRSHRNHPDITRVPDRLVKSLSECLREARLPTQQLVCEDRDGGQIGQPQVIPANVTFWYAFSRGSMFAATQTPSAAG